MLYEMLTGPTPCEANNYRGLAPSPIYEPVPPPSPYNPRISPAVQSVILKALEKEPAHRFQTANDMAATLEAAVAAQTPVAQATGRQPAPQRVPTAGPLPGVAPSTPPQAQPIYCPRCHAANQPHQRFCSTCGLAFAQPKSIPSGQRPQPTANCVSCPQRQTLNQPINHFCTTCGYNLLAAATSVTSPTS